MTSLYVNFDDVEKQKLFLKYVLNQGKYNNKLINNKQVK